MKLTKKDIQYIMNEARNIVAEKKGLVRENVAVDSVKTATDAKAKSDIENANNTPVGKAVKKGVESLVGVVKNANGKVNNAVNNAKNKIAGSASKAKPGNVQANGKAVKSGVGTEKK
jgi:hypothetical protein